MEQDMKAVLEWHLQHNHYPALPTTLIPVAEKAIELANEAYEALTDADAAVIWERLLDLPEGMDYQGSPSVSVTEAVESMHLNDFIEIPGDFDTI